MHENWPGLKAEKTGSATDWIVFRHPGNKCSYLIKKAKSEYYLSITTKNLNDPRKFWKSIKSLSVTTNSHVLPIFVMKDSVTVHNKMETNCFNKHYVSSGSLFNSAYSASVTPCTDVSVFAGQPFNFVPLSMEDVRKALKY